MFSWLIAAPFQHSPQRRYRLEMWVNSIYLWKQTFVTTPRGDGVAKSSSGGSRATGHTLKTRVGDRKLKMYQIRVTPTTSIDRMSSTPCVIPDVEVKSTQLLLSLIVTRYTSYVYLHEVLAHHSFPFGYM